MTTLHIYTRVSTRIQDTDGTSLDTQKNLGITKSKEMGFDYKVWNEGGASSHHEDLENRPVLMNLLSEVEKGLVKHLFVYNNDRLSRNEITAQTIRIALQRNDVVLYTKDGQFDLTNPSDKLFKTILDGIAQYDNALRAERSRLGKIARVRQGFWYGAPPPFGYEIVDKKLSIHPEESKWVKKIFRWYVDGKSTQDIKAELDASGVQPRRKRGTFSMGSIQRLIRNTHYVGRYDWTDKKSAETINCICPHFIDETLWNNAQSKKKKIGQRRGQLNRTKRFYLLRNLMFCDHCGTGIGARTKPSKYEYFYYCPNKERTWVKGSLDQDSKWARGEVNGHGCDMTKSLSIPIADKLIWDKVVETVSNSSTLKESFKQDILDSKFRTDQENKIELRASEKRTKKLMRNLKEVQSTIADVETKRLLKQYDEEVYKQINENLRSEIDSLKGQIEQARLRTKEFGSERKWLDWVEKYRDRLDGIENLSDPERKEYLEGIVDRIGVSLDQETRNHKLSIKFKLPMVDDSIEYADPKCRSQGYVVHDGVSNVTVEMRNEERRGRKKKNLEIPPLETQTSQWNNLLRQVY